MDQIISKGASGVTYSFCIILHKAKKKKKKHGNPGFTNLLLSLTVQLTVNQSQDKL